MKSSGYHNLQPSKVLPFQSRTNLCLLSNARTSSCNCVTTGSVDFVRLNCERRLRCQQMLSKRTKLPHKQIAKEPVGTPNSEIRKDSWCTKKICYGCHTEIIACVDNSPIGVDILQIVPPSGGTSKDIAAPVKIMNH